MTILGALTGQILFGVLGDQVSRGKGDGDGAFNHCFIAGRLLTSAAIDPHHKPHSNHSSGASGPSSPPLS
jgi:hypothetical protein